MAASRKVLGFYVLILGLGLAPFGLAQESPAAPARTMRPVIRGRVAAISSMTAQATEAARRILAEGGNAFDAAVGGQAALAVADFPSNGVGSDAELLVYLASQKKVLSINAEPRAPKLATMEWYEKNNGGKIPDSDGLLSGGIPGVVDAWYILLDRWGTMSFEQVLQPAIELARDGFPISEGRANAIAYTKKILKYPTTVKIYLPDGQPRSPGRFSGIPISPEPWRSWLKPKEPPRQRAGTRRSRRPETAFTKATSRANSRPFPKRTADFSVTRTSPNTRQRSRTRSPSTTAAIRSTRTLRPARGLRNSLP